MLAFISTGEKEKKVSIESVARVDFLAHWLLVEAD